MVEQVIGNDQIMGPIPIVCSKRNSASYENFLYDRYFCDSYSPTHLVEWNLPQSCICFHLGTLVELIYGIY